MTKNNQGFIVEESQPPKRKVGRPRKHPLSAAQTKRLTEQRVKEDGQGERPAILISLQRTEELEASECASDVSREGSIGDGDEPICISKSMSVRGTPYHTVHFKQRAPRVQDGKPVRRTLVKPRVYSSTQLTELAPQLLIDYYESCIRWNEDPVYRPKPEAKSGAKV